MNIPPHSDRGPALPAEIDAYLRDLPALVAGPRGALVRHHDGRSEEIPLAQLAGRLLRQPVIVCNQMLVARRAGVAEPRFLDILELFAFIRPAEVCIPTASGIAAALGLLPPGHDAAHEAAVILQAVRRLCADLLDSAYPYAAGIAGDAADMANAGWPWGELMLLALARRGQSRDRARNLFDDLPEWEDEAPPPPPGTRGVDPVEAVERLTSIVGDGAEKRPAQRDFAAAVAGIFAPALQVRAPIALLAEAGTGTGKTLGYVAPASLWAERNGGSVWLSTYTKNLQRQLDQELQKLYPDPRVRAARAVIRKGRENYLCLLNLEERSRQGALNPMARTLVGLVKRWARYTRDGDMVGGDFPSWLAGFYGGGRIAGLTDRRGECIYSACPHYRRCFIEHSTRKARRADLIIANHALVMVQAVRRRTEQDAPKRVIFDEGHHLFDAADSAFAVGLTGAEAIELRRWIRGTEGGGRARGLSNRMGDLVADDPDSEKLLKDVLQAAQSLPGDGWLKRLQEGDPFGPAERFLYLVRAQVLARASDKDEGHGLEAETTDPIPGLVDAAMEFDRKLEDLARPLQLLATALLNRLDRDAAELDSATRNRMESVARSITWRAEMVTHGWRAMLASIDGPPHEKFVDWFAVERAQGRELDVGMHRRWIDPTEPFAEAVLEDAHGVVITSATLRDHDPESPGNEHWQSAELRTGFSHLAIPPARLSVPSPFDYAARTRVFVVTDVRRNSPEQVAAAYRELFLASGGGGLGLFTAISRLKGVHERIEGPLHEAGIPLYAQHVTPMDTGNLIDIFRAEENSCLLGTDAVRDGVDVPGRALRLIVFDRVPWPRPTILHRVRRNAFGGRRYDDMVARLKLKQAFGRLIRRAGDQGVFVILDSATPSRLLTAFPEGVTVERVGLRDAIEATRSFLGASAPF